MLSDRGKPEAFTNLHRPSGLGWNEHNCSVLMLSDLKPGDRLCCIHDTEDELRAVLRTFLGEGLDRNEKILCIAEGYVAAAIQTILRDRNLDAGSLMSQGRLAILAGRDACAREGAVEPDAMANLLRTESEGARSGGFSALRVVVGMSGMPGGPSDPHLSTRYAAAINALPPGCRCIIMSCYDRRKCPADMLLDALRTHPIAVMNGELYDNFYYVPASQAPATDIALATLTQWQSQLKRHKQAETALCEARDAMKASLLAIPDLMFEVDRAGRITDYHAPRHELLYAPPEAFLGRLFSEVLPPEAARTIDQAMAEATRNGWHRGATFVLDMPSGQRWFELSVAREGDDPEAADLRFVALSRDITERKRTEQALRNSEERLRALSAASMEGIAVSMAGRLTDANDQFLRMSGYERNELIGTAVENLISPEDRERVMNNILAERESITEHRMLRKDGGTLVVEARGRTISYHGGRVRFTAIRDLTKRKQQEENLRAANETLEAIIAASPVAVIALDTDGKVTLWNPAAERMFGWTAAEAVGRINPIVPPDKRDEFLDHHRRQLQGDAFTTIERRRQRKDGSLIDVRLHGAALYDSAGRARGVMGVIEDITDQKLAEENLQRMAAIIDNSSDFIAIRSIHGDSTVVNPVAFSMLGYDRAEKATLTVEEVHPPEDAERIKRVCIPEAVEKGVWRGDNRLLHRDGHIIPVEQVIFPVRDKDSRLLGVATIIRDVTDRRRAEEERERLQAQLRQSQKLEAVGLLAGGVAHEFNNLLMVILGNSDLALQARAGHTVEGDRAVDVALKEIRLAANRAASLTRQLLTFSRKQEAPHPERIDLRQVVGNIKGMLRQTIGETIQFKVASDSNNDCVLANAVQIEQAILNLAINARDAMPRGGNLTIEVATVILDEDYVAHHAGSRTGPHVMIAVTDTGTGMDEETQAHLFEPFFTTKPVGKGTGLGLATVYGIVQQAKGHIQVHSAAGEGSSFRLFFPVVPGTAAVEDQQAPRSIGGMETILLCDDNTLVRRVVRNALKEHGYHVLEAETVSSAIRLAEEHDGPIHLLVTDLVMPEMNGYELAEALKKRRPAIRTLYISGYAPDTLETHVPSIGDSLFLQKPFVPGELLHHVRQVLDNA